MARIPFARLPSREAWLVLYPVDCIAAASVLLLVLAGAPFPTRPRRRVAVIPTPRRPADDGTSCRRHPAYVLASCDACIVAHTRRITLSRPPAPRTPTSPRSRAPRPS